MDGWLGFLLRTSKAYKPEFTGREQCEAGRLGYARYRDNVPTGVGERSEGQVEILKGRAARGTRYTDETTTAQ